MAGLRKTNPRPSGARPALKLVKTQAMSRDQWLDIRRQGIGSSDAAAAVGLNPYKSPLQLWLEKTGRDQALPKVDPNDESSPMYWGTLLEPIVAAHYTRRTGHRVRRINAVLQHAQRPWMLANIDREVTGAPDVQILECKTAGNHGARLWEEGVPEYVQLQVLHQLAVTGKQAADVAVLVCGQELRVHRIERDEAAIANLIELEQRFWWHVENDSAPPADGSESAMLALKALWPRDRGNTLDLRGELDMASAFSDLVALRARLKDLEAQEARVRQRIQQRMGDASVARFEGGEVRWKRAKDSQILDVARLAADHPALASAYRTTKDGARRLTVRVAGSDEASPEPPCS